MVIIKWILVLLVGAAIGYFAHDYIKFPPATTPDTLQHQNTNSDSSGVVCAQVITMARDPKTGDLKQYKTPCDVPKGWEVIQNDVPGLDLQPQ